MGGRPRHHRGRDATFLREYDHLTLVRLRLAHHRRDSGTPGSVSELLDRLHADAYPARGGSLLEIGMLRALTHHAAGHRAEALAELARALTRAPEPDGYVRLFLDEGAPTLALLQDAAGSRDDVVRRQARRLLDAARGAPAARAGRPAHVAAAPGELLAEPLSDRELDVLRLLDSDLTGPEIARRIFVSVNTLRSHTKRIFTKLDVNNRSAAVRRGRRLGLL